MAIDNNSNDRTICSISTPPRLGGIGIVRMSGPDAIGIAGRLFTDSGGESPERMPHYTIRYGKVRDPETGAVIDEALLTVMRAPRTYTREDVVEINCHSGPVVLRRILRTLVSLGARLAEPGEFTKRAFLNGRIDLSQAEAVMALISARNEEALQACAVQLEGELAKRIGAVRSRIVRLLSEAEASIDFPEEELDLVTPARLLEETTSVIEEVDALIEASTQGRVLRDGVSTAIVGTANVGKSSLLNLLLMEERAIVTPIPGTTRDVVDGMVNVEGVPLRIVDTAGIRDSEDPIEREGVRRSRASLRAADLVLLVLDLSREIGEADLEIARMIASEGKKAIVVLNKVDLINDKESRHHKTISSVIESKYKLYTSCISKIGIEALKKAIKDLIGSDNGSIGAAAVVISARNEAALNAVRTSLGRAVKAVRAGLSEEFVSLEFREALRELGQITGETTTEEVLDQIFQNFCIGK
jgi:tRNA modification GTPase